MPTTSVRVPPSVVLDLHLASSSLTGGGGDPVQVTMRLGAPSYGERRDIIYATSIDRSALMRLDSDIVEYGRTLSDSIFSDSRAREMLAEALALAGPADMPLRLLISTPRELSWLGQLRWERILDPGTKSPLALLRRVYITRFCNCDRLISPGSRSDGISNALIAVAAPDHLDGAVFPAFDRTAQLQAALKYLKPFNGRAPGARASIGAISEALKSPTDLLVIVCHGMDGAQGPRLWLETDAPDGEGEAIEAKHLVAALDNTRLPLLVVLGSCFSGLPGKSPAPALAPALVEAGVQFVLAMHSAITPQLLKALMETFVAELTRTGHVEEALRVARARLAAEELDWSNPVLYSRVATERFGRTTPSSPVQRTFDRWPLLLNAVEQSTCLPIIGWDADPDRHPTRQQMAHHLATLHGFPGAAKQWPRFTEVARYIVATHGRAVLLKNCRDFAVQLSGAHNEASTTPEPARPSNGGLISTLAQLPLPVYVTTSWFDTVVEALREADKRPRIYYPGMQLTSAPGGAEVDDDAAPADATPLVLHLNGHWSDVESLVATDDDYLMRAMEYGENPELIPDSVRRHLSGSVVLLAGIDVDDLDLRSFLAVHQRFSAGTRRKRHVAVQLDSRTPARPDPLMEQLLQNYFEEVAMSIYWGTPLQFAEDLVVQRSTHAA